MVGGQGGTEIVPALLPWKSMKILCFIISSHCPKLWALLFLKLASKEAQTCSWNGCESSENQYKLNLSLVILWSERGDLLLVTGCKFSMCLLLLPITQTFWIVSFFPSETVLCLILSSQCCLPCCSLENTHGNGCSTVDCSPSVTAAHSACTANPNPGLQTARLRQEQPILSVKFDLPCCPSQKPL